MPFKRSNEARPGTVYLLSLNFGRSQHCCLSVKPLGMWVFTPAFFPSFFLHPVRTQRFGRSVYPILPPLHSRRLTPVGSPVVQGEAGLVAPVGLQFEGFQSRRTLFLSTILVFQDDNSPFLVYSTISHFV